jgi:phosphoenolpyruvate carboxykinase (ATP)
LGARGGDWGVRIPSLEEMTIEDFIDTFHRILDWKRSIGQLAYYDNPPEETLRRQAEFYGERYANGSVGWASNIWSRSAAFTDVVGDDSELRDEHKLLMGSALEYVLAPNPLIKVDGVYGENERVRFHCRVWCDARYPDLPLRWRALTFPADPQEEPDMELLMLPGLWTPAAMPGSGGRRPLFIIRFPHHWFTLETVSSYMGEMKKACLTHWIYHVYLQGGLGVHAGSKVFTVKTVDGEWRRIGMIVWGLTGSGKSTHSMYVFDESNAGWYRERGIDVLSLVRDQHIKNDDIVALFPEDVYGSERGAWTKTEDLTPSQVAMYKACMSPRAMHENTGMGRDGSPDFLDQVLHYRGRPNANARTVAYLEDMSPYFDGSVDLSFPPNMAVFISPGYLVDYAWVRIEDANFAAAVLAAGRTLGHPAQAAELVGKERYVPLYNPFIIGVSPADHVHRFRDIKLERDRQAEETDEDALECYLINTTGRIGTEYLWREGKPEVIFQERRGKKRPVGGTGPSIEETELFLLQAARRAVRYRPHPLWGDRVLIPVEVPGIPNERLRELDPLTYRSMEEMKRLLEYQISRIKEVFNRYLPGLDREIYHAMDIDR